MKKALYPARTTLGPVQTGIILLTLATAGIHLGLFVSIGDPAYSIFVLNALGYLALVAALYLPVPGLARTRRVVRWLLIGYTFLTIVLWVLMGQRDYIAYSDKVIEMVLIGMLLVQNRRERGDARTRSAPAAWRGMEFERASGGEEV